MKDYPKKRRLPYGIFSVALIALILSGASLRDPTTTAPLLQGFLRSILLFLSLLCFCRWLPRRFSLPGQILAAMVAGIVAGALLPLLGEADFVRDYIGIFGRLFILLLTFTILPLIFVSVLTGTAGIGDPSKLGSVGTKSLVYYCTTTGLAVLLGLFLVNTIRPGVGRTALIPEQSSAAVLSETDGAPAADGAAETEDTVPSLGRRLQDEILPSLIRNPVMVGENPLVVIFFALILGAALATLGTAGQPVLQVFQSLDRALIRIIIWVMFLAPMGVFALMTCAISDLGLGYMLTLTKYFFTVMLGLSLHFCVLCFVICPLLGRVSPRFFLKKMIPVFQVAFSTSSSLATLPVSIESVEKGVGADRSITNFMLPLGATINMDGTALYLSVAALFVAQVYGMQLGFQQQFMIFMTAILASIGTAGIPGASIGLMGIIFSTAGIPMEGIAIVLGVDRLLDMSRTVVNVTGDCVGAVVVSRSEGKIFAPAAPADLRADP